MDIDVGVDVGAVHIDVDILAQDLLDLGLDQSDSLLAEVGGAVLDPLVDVLQVTGDGLRDNLRSND